MNLGCSPCALRGYPERLSQPAITTESRLRPSTPGSGEPLFGCIELADGLAKLARPAWLSGFLNVAIGIAVLSVATVFWSRTGARCRPISERQKRNAAWMYARPGVMVIAMGLSFGLMGGALWGLREGDWLLRMALWLPGGAVFGLVMVRELRRRTVLSPE